MRHRVLSHSSSARSDEEGCSELCQTAAVGPAWLHLPSGRRRPRIPLEEMPEFRGVMLNLWVSEPDALGPNPGSATH